MSRGIGDHPDIAAAMATGYPSGQKRERVCPVCGEDLSPDDTVYMNWREVIGREHCINGMAAIEIWEDE